MADFRLIPSIDELRQRGAIRALERRFGAHATVDALRAAASSVRDAIAAGDGSLTTDTSVVARIESVTRARLDEQFRPSLEPVINASGVLIHTNLGRAPLAAAAIDRIADVARGYSTLEYDVAQGGRGRRDRHAEALLCRLTGADAAVVVNNNAAATLLGLREVGTTNKTRAADYAAAIGDRTALILRVHPSNFRIEGFTERPDVGELVAIGRRFNVAVAEDLGSGDLGSDGGQMGVRPRSETATWSEPAVGTSINAGVDICCFSGDKLLGGPQAGVIVGRVELVDRVRRHPLMRALRVDKLTYAALEATLAEYAAGRAETTVPVQRMLTLTADEIRVRANAVATTLNTIEGWHAELVEGASAVGGGSAPGVELPTWLVAIDRRGLTSSTLEERLRQLTPPVIARIERDRVLLDLRTVLPDQDSHLLELIQRAS